MKDTQPAYIIVQAGGKGTRLGPLTRNKPKALVPVENLPMLFHLFRRFPESRFIVIADYKREVLRRYLRAFAEVEYTLVEAEGTGTCGGLRMALEQVPEGTPFGLIWSDLILPEGFRWPGEPGNYVGLSQTFPCRWSWQAEGFAEQPSVERGIAGAFVFQDKALLAEVPESGELVAWLAKQPIPFREMGLAGTREFGLLEEYRKLEAEKCRPFNRITEKDGLLVKEGITPQGQALAEREEAWYRAAEARGFTAIPKIYGYSPLRMEKLPGGTLYEQEGLSLREKGELLDRTVEALRELHGLETCPADRLSLEEAYVGKTFRRLEQVRELVPFAGAEYVTVNGRKCRNAFALREELESAFRDYACPAFALIHGDCTYSNILLDGEGRPVFIDPRGYFGHTELFGDPLYDWAKLYYSLAGNYDRFNLKQFSLEIGEGEVRLDIASNGWEALEGHCLESVGVPAEKLKLIHAVIWLSLTTYAWEDYDSICGAYFNGLRYLEEALS